MERLPERDWKVFSRLKPLALDRKYQIALNEFRRILADTTSTNKERYHAIYEAVHKQDKDVAIAFDHFSRSKAPINLLIWHNHGLITEEEFAEFSEETRQWVISTVDACRRDQAARQR